MTIEELLGMSYQQLEAMSDSEIYEHLKHMLPLTRPELASKHNAEQFEFNKGGINNKSARQQSKAAQANEILKKFGLKHIKI